jgi:transposase-like protein
MPRRTRRNFTPGFKAQIVLQLISGQHSAAELCREHLLSASLLTTWKETVLDGLPSLFQGSDQQGQQQTRIAELEQLVGRQALDLGRERGRSSYFCELASAETRQTRPGKLWSPRLMPLQMSHKLHFAIRFSRPRWAMIMLCLTAVFPCASSCAPPANQPQGLSLPKPEAVKVIAVEGYDLRESMGIAPIPETNVAPEYFATILDCFQPANRKEYPASWEVLTLGRV